MADVDPVYDSAAILDDKFKLIIGNPTVLAFDQVYPLITVHDTSMKFGILDKFYSHSLIF